MLESPGIQFGVLHRVQIIGYFALRSIAQRGVNAGSVAAAPHWTAFIGTAVYSFEGIGVAIPIREAMRNPDDFPYVMGTTVALIAVVLASFGLVGSARTLSSSIFGRFRAS